MFDWFMLEIVSVAEFYFELWFCVLVCYVTSINVGEIDFPATFWLD